MSKLTIALLVAVLGACSSDRSAGSSGEKPAATQAATSPAPSAATTTGTGVDGHAAAGVKPGSHEDWCGEHGVPESQCTKCNPDLVAAYKATDDWCEEHGLPESHCLKCNPDLKLVRPPKGQ